jgi:hypothetical protein
MVDGQICEVEPNLAPFKIGLYTIMNGCISSENAELCYNNYFYNVKYLQDVCVKQNKKNR